MKDYQVSPETIIAGKLNDEAIKEVDMSEFKDERFILLNEDQRVRKIVNKLFDEYSISPEEIMEIQQSTTGFAMAVAGMGVTLVAADGAEAYSMVIGGHADMTLGSPADGKQYVDAGQVNPLIVINTARSSALPDVPCSADFGLTADLGPWRAIMAKKGTPQEAIDSLEAAFTDVMDNDDTWKEWKEVNGLNDRDGQFTQEEMKQVWSDYFDTISDIAK